ncbi:MAG: phosphatidylglycerophosphatase A [Candidatus Omnitrophica bacterium]|nr:phosphatidylglycerophosphatase A [Candidatus Omnitrophota bacterium]
MKSFEKKIIDYTASCGHIGYIPLGGGTIAALAGTILYAFIADFFTTYLIILISTAAIGLLITKKAGEIYKQKDSPKIVIDEFSASLLVFFMIPAELKYLIIGFILFRIFDITKPYPANKLDDSSSTFGVMGDDFVAAIYTNLILQAIKIFW